MIQHYNLSGLQETLTQQQINELDSYLYNLTGGAKENILISKVAYKLDIPILKMAKAFRILVKNNVLKMKYCLICPKCGLILKKQNSPGDFLGIDYYEYYCYGCDSEFRPTISDLCKIYEINN